jgi:peptide/nickel transport system substrate-binding protein
MKEMKTIKRRWVGIVSVLAVAGILLMPAGNVYAAPQGVLKQAIHWSFSADWLDPSMGSFPIPAYHPLYLFHDALLKPMPGGLFTPSLAESWTISEDSKTYEFKIRKGVKFQNGDALTADDVVFTIKRYKGANAKTILGRIEQVEAVNPFLVRIRFKESFPDFLEYMLPGATTIAWIVPKKYIEKIGDAAFKKAPVGAGPYRYVEHVPGVKLVAEAFDGYWRKTPHIKRMEFFNIPEPATRLSMVKRGEADIATLMQGVYYEDLKKTPNLRVLLPLSPVNWMAYLGAQWDPKSPWADPRVRKAASLAIDRQTLADIHMPGAGPVGSLAMGGDPTGINFPADPYDPAAAKKLLAEAGYPSGFNGGKFYPYEGGYWPYGEQVSNYLKAVGINVETVLLDKPALLAQRAAGKMKDAVFIDNPTAPTVAMRLSILFGGGSYGNYPDLAELWNKYQKEPTQKGRKTLSDRIQTLVHERTMWIPLTSTNSPAAIGPRVKGNPYKIQPLIWFTCPFEDIELNP